MNFQELFSSMTRLHDGQFASWSTFLACIIASLILGLALTRIYRIYFIDSDAMDASLAKSLTFMTPALAVVFLVIQTNVSLSVGVLGSLAFVRFRTPIKRAEDVIFVLFSLASALLCSTGLYHVAALLIGIFLIFAWVYNLSQRRVRLRPRFAIVTVNTRKTDSIKEVTQMIGDELAKRAVFVSTRTYDGLTSFVINLHDLDFDSHGDLVDRAKTWDPTVQLNVFYPTEALGS